MVREEELLSQYLLELRKIDLLEPVVRLLQILLGHLILSIALLEYLLDQPDNVNIFHAKATLELHELHEDIIGLPKSLFNIL